MSGLDRKTVLIEAASTVFEDDRYRDYPAAPVRLAEGGRRASLSAGCAGARAIQASKALQEAYPDVAGDAG